MRAESSPPKLVAVTAVSRLAISLLEPSRLPPDTPTTLIPGAEVRSLEEVVVVAVEATTAAEVVVRAVAVVVVEVMAEEARSSLNFRLGRRHWESIRSIYYLSMMHDVAILSRAGLLLTSA
jgi:hypothetical protein